MVCDLAAHLGIEDGIVQNDSAFVPGLDDRLDIGAGVIVFVAEEICRRMLLCVGYFNHALLLRLTRPIALLLHQFFEAIGINRESALAGHQFGKIERKPLFVVESKGEFPGDG